MYFILFKFYYLKVRLELIYIAPEFLDQHIKYKRKTVTLL